MALSLRPLGESRGRALYAGADGALWRSQHLDIDRSSDGAVWTPAWSIPGRRRDVLPRRSRLAARFLRYEVRAFLPLPDGGAVAATRHGVFVGRVAERRMVPAAVAGGAASPPMSFAAGPDGAVLWGEYGPNPRRRPVGLYFAGDGRRFERVWTFAEGEVRHVHGALWDPGLDAWWVFVGDHGSEPGIALFDRRFRDRTWVVRGEQRHRLVGAFDLGDRLVYGTDTELEGNAVYALDKASGGLRKLADLDGSSIYQCRVGSGFALSTTAEPRKDGAPLQASLYLSADGERWTRHRTWQPDGWQPNLFQFGSLVLARGGGPTLLYSGQALAGADGRLYAAAVERA